MAAHDVLEMPDEQAQNLRALQLAADEPDAELQRLDDAEGEQAQALHDDQNASNSKNVALILALAVPVLGKFYPSIGVIYTDDVQADVARTIGPVLSKYGIDLDSVAGNYGPEIAAAFVCVPLAMATVAGVKADILASRRESPKGDPLRAVQVAQADQGETVVLG